MIIKNEQKSKILNLLPKIELSYIKNIHKKVHTDIYITIPKGKKYLAWFKCWNNQNCCFFLQLDTYSKKITNVYVYPCVFDHILCSGNGTILYGTLINNTPKLFSTEDIFYYKNKNVNFCNFNNKLLYLKNMFSLHIKQMVYNNNDIIIGLPVMDIDYNNLIKKCDNLPYSLFCIQFRKLYKKSAYLNYKIKLQNQVAIFEVTPCVEHDLYLLSCNDNSKIINHNFCYIPNYKTSVFMNSLFRNIKENINLDLLEESDDEEEFENINIDKYVHLEKKIIMTCVYVPKMKLWKPIEITDKEISLKNFIIGIEKK
tara:strand:- start:211 stop:1149 length:939 start_codon:yes stop_codon:yes gene_type:complete